MASDEPTKAPAPPQPEPTELPTGETHKADKHTHIWRGFRGGGVSKQMCVVCGKAKEVETLEEEAPAPEPVK